MAIVAENIEKAFGRPSVKILKGLNLTIKDGDFFAITGRSGSGKSTFLYVMSSLDEPTTGRVLVDSVDVHKLESKEVHRFRNQKMGFVFQFHYLLPELTALENVLMPAIKDGSVEKRQPYALELLKEFGLDHRLHHRPSALSGGELQRIAIARALIMEPKYLFADEPTGNLDSLNGDIVMRILSRFNVEKKMTIVFVTHDQGYAKMANRRIHLVDGVIAEAG